MSNRVRLVAHFASFRLVVLAFVLFGLSACDAMAPETGVPEGVPSAEGMAGPEQEEMIEAGQDARAAMAATSTCSSEAWESRSGTVQYCGRTYADLDGDGRQEVFVRTTDGRWMLSESPSETGVQINASTHPFGALAFGDFNGDGTEDVFNVGMAYTWEVRYSGKGTPKRLNNAGAPLTQIAFGDFNGDGKTDVMRPRPTEQKWYVSWGGTSAWRVLNTSRFGLADLAFGDFNGDGKTDVFRTDPIDGGWWISWDGRAAFTKINRYRNLLSELRFADVNRDGRMDVLRRRNGQYEVSYSARGAWQVAPTFDAQQSIRKGDVDGDSKPDSYAYVR